MATVTFYKTKMNRSNRAYDGAALDTILNAAPKLAFDVPNGVIPNVPFVIRSGETAAITDILNGYDYITYSYSGKTFYAFLDSVQFLATSAGNCSVMHSTDVWAMAVKYSVDTLHFNGNVERAHVNDLIGLSFNNGRIDMKYTTGTPEAQYNKMYVKKEIPEMSCYNDNGWYLYIYFANVNELTTGMSDKPQIKQYWCIENANLPSSQKGKCFNSEGLVAVYYGEGETNDADITFTAISPVALSDKVSIGKFTINDLTSSAITAMTLSKIPPVHGGGEGKAAVYGVSQHTNEMGGVNTYWDDDYIKNNGVYYTFNHFTPNPAEGLPQYINYFECHGGTGQSYHGIPYSLNISKTDDFNEYLKQIPKMISPIYNPLYILDDIGQLPILEGGNYNLDWLTKAQVSYSPDLKNLLICLPEGNNFRDKAARYILVPNKSLFSPDVVNDYWTQLNAEQTGLKAQSNKFNAIVNAVSAPLKGLSEGAQAGAPVAVGNAIMGTLQAGANAVFDVQAADRLNEVADRQYDCGSTTAYNTTGLYNALSNLQENYLVKYSCEFQYDVIAPQLHRNGYNTFLQIDEIYANHKRECFNYFKGVDVSVSGVLQAWCDEIASMFNSGVTLWESDVENYERVNYQQGLWEDN